MTNEAFELTQSATNVESSSPAPQTHKVIAIDGPAASGKSTVARLLAKRLGYAYVNTGAMYRAVTWLALQHGVTPSDSQAIVALIHSVPMEFSVQENESRIRIEGIDPAPYLNEPDVNSYVSTVAAIPGVREILVARQREFARDYDIVMEGRDIGTVVFPHTPHKAYIDASEEERARRRAAQGICEDLNTRDKNDSKRSAAPLKVADGAQIIDSTRLSIEGVVEEVVRKLGLEKP